MRTAFKCLVALIYFGVLSAGYLSAQDFSGEPKNRGGMRPNRGGMVGELADKLSLTDAQKSKIEDIFKANMKNMKPGERPDREEMEKSRKAMESEIEKVLTPEQKEKYEALKKERKGKSPKGQGQEGKKNNQGGMLRELSGRLNLTSGQKTKIEEIMKTNAKNAKQDKTPNWEEMEKMRAAMDTEIEKVLTAEQKDIFNEMKKEMKSMSPGKPRKQEAE